MAKYNYELKKRIVEDYLAGKGGHKNLAKKYGIPAYSNVKKWINNYQAYGNEGLLRSRKNKIYSIDYKLHVVELYLTSEVSYQKLAIQEGINNPSQITKWVNDFRIAGPDALRPKRKGRKKALRLSDKSRKSTSPLEKLALDIGAERLKQLEDENLKLRIENAYLKELRRLRLEDEARLREQQESSTTSEETSN